MNNTEAIEIIKKDMDRIIELNPNGKIEKEFDLFQAEALAIHALENELDNTEYIKLTNKNTILPKATESEIFKEELFV